jgi:hypothetical protein
MKTPKAFNKLSRDEQADYVKKKLAAAQAEEKFWKDLSRKLAYSKSKPIIVDDGRPDLENMKA